LSNVLIGIIGVILFIGLALAGALILGDDFKAASRDSKVTNLIAKMQQMANGLDMYNIKTGRQFPAMVSIYGDTTIVPRYIKEPYSEPEGGGGPIIYIYAGQRYLVLGALSEAMCKGINLNLNGNEIIPDVPQTTTPVGSMGCMSTTGNRMIFVKM
jgi:hypothetical protein